MRPYGIPRDPCVKLGYDVADIQYYARKGSFGRVTNKTGDYHPYAGRSAAKRRAGRRLWKKMFRKQINKPDTQHWA